MCKLKKKLLFTDDWLDGFDPRNFSRMAIALHSDRLTNEQILIWIVIKNNYTYNILLSYYLASYCVIACLKAANKKLIRSLMMSE